MKRNIFIVCVTAMVVMLASACGGAQSNNLPAYSTQVPEQVQATYTPLPTYTPYPTVPSQQPVQQPVQQQPTAVCVAQPTLIPTAAPTTIVATAMCTEYPTTAEEAAACWGGKPQWWHKDKDSAWQCGLKPNVKEGELPFRMGVNPGSFLLEGYYDTAIHSNAVPLAATGVTVLVQGCTIWPEKGTAEGVQKLAAKMQTESWTSGVHAGHAPIAYVQTWSENWPINAQEAATIFGGDAEKWELQENGGWHLQESPISHSINAHQWVAEGYVDTDICFVYSGQKDVQGTTIWPRLFSQKEASKLLSEMKPKKNACTIEGSPIPGDAFAEAPADLQFK